MNKLIHTSCNNALQLWGIFVIIKHVISKGNYHGMGRVSEGRVKVLR
jgi:hypothetical protein